MEERLFDGRWKTVGYVKKGDTYGFIKLINIYNNNELVISTSQYNSVVEGKDTISHIICRKIPPVGNIPVDNGVKNNYAKQRLKHCR